MPLEKKTPSPLWWVPSAYLTMGLAFVTLNSVAAIMFKNLGMDNGKAAEYASLLILAYTIKPLFSPVVEMYRTKKFFVITCQLAIGTLFGVAAMVLSLPNYMMILLPLFFVISVLGSTQDIATDGLFITVLSGKQQSLYCGVQGLAWNLAPILATGGLVYLSGYLHSEVFGHNPAVRGDQWIDSWRIIFFILAALCVTMPFWHMRFMPAGAKAEHTPATLKDAFAILTDAFTTFFHKKDIWKMITFTLLFLVSVGFIDKIGPFFMVDPIAKGGLGLSNEVLGIIYGTYGLISVLLGSLLGGLYIAKRGIKASMMVLCCAVNIPNASFLILSLYQPESLLLITLGVVVEKFFYGFGAVGLVVYIMQQMAPGKYATAHYAFATALKGLGFMLTGMLSGHLQLMMGYTHYFIFVMAVALPSLLICWFLPFNLAGDHQAAKDAKAGTSGASAGAALQT